MNWPWLPLIEQLERRVAALEGMQTLVSDLAHKQATLNDQIRELRELRELMRDPKKIPIRTTRTSQFRTIMEEEPL